MKYYGVNGIGQKTGRAYPTENLAILVIKKYTKRYMAKIKKNGQLPYCWAIEAK